MFLKTPQLPSAQQTVCSAVFIATLFTIAGRGRRTCITVEKKKICIGPMLMYKVRVETSTCHIYFIIRTVCFQLKVLSKYKYVWLGSLIRLSFIRN